MSGFVLDVSVTMAWCFEDEATAETWAILDRLQDEGAVVPALWPLEVATSCSSPNGVTAPPPPRRPQPHPDRR